MCIAASYGNVVKGLLKKKNAKNKRGSMKDLIMTDTKKTKIYDERLDGLSSLE